MANSGVLWLWGLRGDGIHGHTEKGALIDYYGSSPPKLPDLRQLADADANPTAIGFPERDDGLPEVDTFEDPTLFAVANRLVHSSNLILLAMQIVLQQFMNMKRPPNRKTAQNNQRRILQLTK